MSKFILVPKVLFIKIRHKILSQDFHKFVVFTPDLLNSICKQVINERKVLELTIALISVFSFPNLLKKDIDLVTCKNLLKPVITHNFENGSISKVEILENLINLIVFKVINDLIAQIEQLLLNYSAFMTKDILI